MPLELSIDSIILAGLIFLLLLWVLWLQIRVHKLLRGDGGKKLEGRIRKIEDNQKSLELFRVSIEKYLKGVENRLCRSIQGVSTIRFDAFEGTGEGGRQSFATAFLDENGDGLVISSLYRRDHIGVLQNQSIVSNPLLS